MEQYVDFKSISRSGIELYEAFDLTEHLRSAFGDQKALICHSLDYEE
jgi:hypothetical protein